MCDEFSILECQHSFCGGCIESWSLQCTSCPLCKVGFSCFYRYRNCSFQVQSVQPRQLSVDSFQQDFIEQDCYVCLKNEREDLMLVCDSCDFRCCHIYCLEPKLHSVPEGDWICHYCKWTIYIIYYSIHFLYFHPQSYL